VKFDPDMFILVVLGEPLFGLRVMVASRRSKAAVTALWPDEWPTVTLHVRAEPEQSPPQPPKEDPDDSVAVRVRLDVSWPTETLYVVVQVPVWPEEQSMYPVG
jgi:hypothetical protein